MSSPPAQYWAQRPRHRGKGAWPRVLGRAAVTDLQYEVQLALRLKRAVQRGDERMLGSRQHISLGLDALFLLTPAQLRLRRLG